MFPRRSGCWLTRVGAQLAGLLVQACAAVWLLAWAKLQRLLLAKPHLALVSNPPLVAELCWSADFDLSASSADLLLFFPTPFPPRLLGS